MPDEPAPESPRPGRRAAGFPGRWLPWLLGGAILAAVVVVAMRSAEARDFVRITERAEPWWLLLAAFVQAATYLAQGEVFRVVGRAARFPLALGLTYRLSLAKLFVDQAIPSAGLSGTALFARGLERAGMPRPSVLAGVVVDLASHYVAFVVALAAALVIAWRRVETDPLALLVTVGFVAFAVALCSLLLGLAGRRTGRRLAIAERVAPLRKALDFVADADATLTRRVPILVEASACQLAIMLLDAATVWLILLSLGHRESPAEVYASLVFSTLFRTIGIVPGGLGTFEAASVVTLTLVGVSVPVALSATLLFRGLSFWLPMLPGIWFSRHAIGGRPA